MHGRDINNNPMQYNFTVFLSIDPCTSSATVRCISCRRCGGMQLLLDTWGPPGIWCRSDHSLECPQTAPHHIPHSVLTPLGPPGCGQHKYYFILGYHCVLLLLLSFISERNQSCGSWGDGQTVTPHVPTGEYFLYSCLQQVHSVFNIKAKDDKTELFWKVIWLITW